MRVHWTALGVGVVLGAVVAYFMKGSGMNKWGITGRFAAPFQQNLDRGGMSRR